MRTAGVERLNRETRRRHLSRVEAWLDYQLFWNCTPDGPMPTCTVSFDRGAVSHKMVPLVNPTAPTRKAAVDT